MKILQVCHRYPPHVGGIENHVMEISEHLARSHDVEVVTADLDRTLPKSEVRNGVKITRFRSFAPGGAYYFSPSQFFYIKKLRPDIIHAHNYHALPALLACRAGRGKFVFTPHYHGKGSTFFRNLLNKPYSIFGNMIFNNSGRIICVSEYEKELVIRNFPGINERKIIIIPNGILLRDIEEAQAYDFCPKLVLFIGRLERYKNIQLIIKAMRYLPDFSFLIIGSSGSYRKDLEDIIRNFRLEGRVRILDNVTETEKYAWLKTCSLFMNLSEIEAFGITVLEALAAGKPVIVNGKGGLSEFAVKFDNVTQVIVDENMDDTAIHNLANLMKEKIGIVAQPDVGQYDWANIVKKIETVYCELLTDNKID